MNDNEILPIILCGGSGTRLWPISRQSFPKQFLSFNNQNRNTLLQNTIQRTNKLKNIVSPILICNEEHRFIVAEQIREINVIANSIILEPFGKNTAPAIAIAALKALENKKDKNLLVLSSDHQIEDEDKFIDIIKRGLEYSSQGKLVTFGINPYSAETGFGYIKSKKPLSQDQIEGSNIVAFIEKPDIRTAKKFIKDKRFTWNSGIFLFKASSILKELEKYNPQLINLCKKSLHGSINDMDFIRLNREPYSNCPNISIDNAVMEETKEGIVLPLDVGWKDIGSWEAIWEISKKDNKGNVLQGNIIANDTKNCLLRSEKRLIAGIGLKDLLVIDSSDAILVANKNNSQQIKGIVEKLKDDKSKYGLINQKVHRPWGHYESLVRNEKWLVKIINVKIGHKLSLQKHNHRSEHWVVVSGTAKIEIEGKEIILEENESCYIPLGSKHRLSNFGNEDLKIIEIQSGDYISEDDIFRFEDNYGRIS